MRTDSPLPPIKRQRHDGWTLDRQMLFLTELRRSRNVVGAAAAAGMNRKSAYRLRERPAGAEFAAAWDRTMRIAPPRRSRRGAPPSNSNKSHSESLTWRQRPQPAAADSPRKSDESPTSAQSSVQCANRQLPSTELLALLRRAMAQRIR